MFLTGISVSTGVSIAELRAPAKAKVSFLVGLGNGGGSAPDYQISSEQGRHVSVSIDRGNAIAVRDKTRDKNSTGSVLSASGSLTEGSSQWPIVIGLTFLTILPALLLAMTPLVRLLVVFHFLRQALGTQTAPSNQVLMGLALMMTWFLIQPVLMSIDKVALSPYRAGQISGETAISLAEAPVKHYLLHYARQKDLEVFAAVNMTKRPQTSEDLPLNVVVPAYILSELKAGFQIGALLFLPFLLVDLVVASITTSVGMMQLPPVIVSTPLKILLFVMVDGWNLLAGQLLKSF